MFVVLMPIVEILPDLMLEKPGQFAIEERFLRIKAQATIPQQFDAAQHPQPTVMHVVELDRNVVGHLQSLMDPHGGEVALESGDRISKLDHLKRFVFRLKIARANPKRIGDQTAESAQRDRGKGEDRRRVFQWRDPGQSEGVSLAIEVSLGDPYRPKKDDRQEQQ